MQRSKISNPNVRYVIGIDIIKTREKSCKRNWIKIGQNLFDNLKGSDNFIFF